MGGLLLRRRMMMQKVETDSPYVVATYAITNGSSASKILNGTWNIRYMRVDGGAWMAPATTHVFGTTGEHVVEYELTDPSFISEKNSQYGRGMFLQCTLLTRCRIPRSVKRGAYTFERCTNLEDVNLDGLDWIGRQMVFSDTKLRGNIMLPSVTEVGLSGLSNTGYTSITLPAIQSLLGQPGSGLGALVSNTRLTYIDLGEDLRSYGGHAVHDCAALRYVIIRAATPPTCSSGTNNKFFGYKFYGSAIYVPDNSVAAYQADTNWSQYAQYIKPLSQFNQ